MNTSGRMPIPHIPHRVCSNSPIEGCAYVRVLCCECAYMHKQLSCQTESHNEIFVNIGKYGKIGNHTPHRGGKTRFDLGYP
jgi:hypothetical protein